MSFLSMALLLGLAAGLLVLGYWRFVRTKKIEAPWLVPEPQQHALF